MPTFVALPPALTAPLPEPAAPSMRCSDRGQPTWCNRDLAEWAAELKAWGGAGWDRVARILLLQPKP